MNERFHLVAPRDKRTIPFRWGRSLEGALFHQGLALVLVRLLVIPVRPQTTTDDGNDKTSIHHPVASSDFPPDIHKLVFTFLESIDDIVCLALASQHFWRIGREYMHDYYLSFLGQWANKKIVCVGNYVKPADYPPGLFSLKELDDLWRRWYIGNDGAHVAENGPLRLYHFTLPDVSVQTLDYAPNTWSSLLVRRLDESTKRIAEDPAYRCVRSELLVSDATYLPKDQKWILQNLTTKEFVRPEAIALKPELIRGPYISVWGFGQVVLSRILWSTPSVPNDSKANPLRGPWAGHRFDITTLTRHRAETNEVGWSDASEYVAAEMVSICESRFGSDWRETVSEHWYRC